MDYSEAWLVAQVKLKAVFNCMRSDDMSGARDAAQDLLMTSRVIVALLEEQQRKVGGPTGLHRK